MMYYGHGYMLGMHFVWWIFWILIVVVLVAVLFRRQSGDGSGVSRSTPLEILERRYAAGEITTQEFEERKAKLMQGSR